MYSVNKSYTEGVPLASLMFFLAFLELRVPLSKKGRCSRTKSCIFILSSLDSGSGTFTSKCLILGFSFSRSTRWRSWSVASYPSNEMDSSWKCGFNSKVSKGFSFGAFLLCMNRWWDSLTDENSFHKSWFLRNTISCCGVTSLTTKSEKRYLNRHSIGLPWFKKVVIPTNLSKSVSSF